MGEQTPKWYYRKLINKISQKIDEKIARRYFNTESTKRDFGLTASVLVEAIKRSTHDWHICISLWPKVYSQSVQGEPCVLPLWNPCTTKRYICISNRTLITQNINMIVSHQGSHNALIRFKFYAAINNNNESGCIDERSWYLTSNLLPEKKLPEFLFASSIKPQSINSTA